MDGKKKCRQNFGPVKIGDEELIEYSNVGLRVLGNVCYIHARAFRGVFGVSYEGQERCVGCTCNSSLARPGCALSALSVSMVDGTAAFQIITRRYEIVQLSLPLL